MEKGLQRSTRQMASAEPRTAPNRSMASLAYCEQEGIYLQQLPPFAGEMQVW